MTGRQPSWLQFDAAWDSCRSREQIDLNYQLHHKLRWLVLLENESLRHHQHHGSFILSAGDDVYLREMMFLTTISTSLFMKVTRFAERPSRCTSLIECFKMYFFLIPMSFLPEILIDILSDQDKSEPFMSYYFSWSFTFLFLLLISSS